ERNPGDMRFSDLPRSSQLYVASTCGLALIQAAIAAWQPAPAASLELFTLLVVAATVAHSFPVSTPGNQAYHVSLPFFVAAISLGNGLSPRSQHIFEFEGLLTDGVLLLMGLPLAHLTLAAPWAAAVGAAALWLIHRVLDLPNVRAQSRQDGLTELFTLPYLT